MKRTIHAFLATGLLLAAVNCGADERSFSVGSALSSTTLSGSVTTLGTLDLGPAPQAIPEPSTLALLAAGGAALAAVSASRRRK